MDARALQIGLAGFGNVGAGVYLNLVRNGDLVAARCGCRLEVRRIAVRDVNRVRAVDPPAALVTADWRELAADPEIDVIVELMGGVSEAYDLVKAALEAGRIVVTGNKALLAERGRELFALARERGVPLLFEAAVAGGIPIIKAIQESLVGNRIESIYGIVNGTCNYILTRMQEAGIAYAEALEEAQRLGYAEADPALDVSGWDAGHKAILLGSLVSGAWVDPGSVVVEGIEHIAAADIGYAERLGYAVKLLAVIRRKGEAGLLEVRVQPSLVPSQHMLAAVHGVFNAVLVRGDVVGDALFYGSGAGRDPTSSAVISDLGEACRAKRGVIQTALINPAEEAALLPVDESFSHYYLRLNVDNLPGVLARVAALLGDHGAGITTVLQPETEGDSAELVMVLGDAPYGSIRRALREIAELDCTRETPVLLRLEPLETRATA
ncbi:MAG TPA: homoserine dehydrogenase [Verrucomicrobiales bacterium]|nr:homoserine dehydrogenase [Verrucomicrobiales bacterium]